MTHTGRTLINGSTRRVWTVWAILLCGALPGFGAEELPLPAVTEPFSLFRLEATVSPESAFAQYATPGVATRLRQLAPVLSPATDGLQAWGFFFGTSVGTMTSLTEEVALTMFYNPWADVALLCEWQSLNGRPVIADVELIWGDVLRKSKAPDLIPLWRRNASVPPPLAVMVAASDSVQAFLDLYGKRGLWGNRDWRKKLTLLRKSDDVRANEQAVGILFNQMLAGVGGFFNDPQLTAVRTAMDSVRSQLIAGNADAVLATAPETTPESRMILQQAPLDWTNATLVSLETNIKNAFVFMADLRHPEHYACFWFTKTADGGAALRRIDFLSHTLSFEEVDTLARQAGMARP